MHIESDAGIEIARALEISDYMYLLDMGKVKKDGPKKDFESDIRQIIKESLMSREEAVPCKGPSHLL